MDPTTAPTPAASSTITSSYVPPATQAPPPLPGAPVHLLEISLISAQSLTPINKSMCTYAVVWINLNRKLTTRTDQHGHVHPTWNEKFTFRLDEKLLRSDDAAITVEIYTIAWFRHILVGTVSVLISDLLNPPSGVALQNLPKNTRFVVLQVRRPSGTPQGILNMGVALLDSFMRTMPLTAARPGENFRNGVEKKVNALGLDQHENEDEDDEQKGLNNKIQLWRSMSVGSELNDSESPLKGGSVCNGSMLNGSELCSDIGPSASIVAAELAMKLHQQPPVMRLNKNTQDEDTGSSILEEMTFEEARAKGYKVRNSRERWRNRDDSDDSELSLSSNRHSRRNSDGGLFSCFIGGIEFTIVCGGNNHPSNRNSNSMTSRRKKIASSEASSDQ